MATRTKASKARKAARKAPRHQRARIKLNVETSAVRVAAADKRKLPTGTVKLRGTNGLVIDIQRLSKGLIRDQRARLVSSMGCISNPGGPSC